MITDCIYYLTKIYPAERTCYLAAGELKWLKTLDALSFNNVVIISSEESCVVDKKMIGALNNVRSQPKLEAYHFNTFNLPNYNYNGLLDSSCLSTFGPNIEEKQALSLANYFKSRQISPNWLISDSLQLQEILESCEMLLADIDVIVTIVSEHQIPNQKISLFELTDYLEKQGFRYITKEPELNPNLCYCIFAKDYLAKHKTLKLEFQKQEKQIAEEHMKQLQEIEYWKEKYTAFLTLESEWNTSKDKLKIEIQTAQQKNSDLSSQLKQSNEANILLQKENTYLSQKLGEDSANREKIAIEIKKHIDESEKRLQNWVYRWAMNTAKQIEDFYSLQEYFKTGELFAGFHGWPISPDIALFIINQMRQKQYDLVIEFGSGTSTLLFAKLAADQHHKGLMSDLASKKIISFDHHEDYYNQTNKLLTINNVVQYVDLVHAPLSEWSENEQIFSYYTCESKLKELSKQFKNKKLNILVLIDGPPGNTCKDARYPAIPFLFKYLGEHQLDIILDDAKRPQEKEVIQKWHEFWNSKTINISDKHIDSEKGIYFATVSK